MKKKNLKNLKLSLNKGKIADLSSMRKIVGGTNACNAESRLICPGDDTSGCNTQLTGCQSIFPLCC